MTLLIDTADVNGAHAAGYDAPHDINSDERLRVWAEHGGMTFARGAGGVHNPRGTPTIELSGEELEATLDALRSHQARERMEAFKARAA